MSSVTALERSSLDKQISGSQLSCLTKGNYLILTDESKKLMQKKEKALKTAQAEDSWRVGVIIFHSTYQLCLGSYGTFFGDTVPLPL